MIALACQHTNRSKQGKRNGQRNKLALPGLPDHVHLQRRARPLGDMRIEMKEAVLVLNMLLEGMSIRACERLTGMKADTICDLIVVVGENRDRFLESAVVNVPVKFVELDEIWDFVGCKDKDQKLRDRTDDCGDSWTWCD